MTLSAAEELGRQLGTMSNQHDNLSSNALPDQNTPLLNFTPVDSVEVTTTA